MKMKKIIASTCLIMATSIIFMSCSAKSTDDPFSVYSNLVKNVSESTEIEKKVVTDMKFDQGDGNKTGAPATSEIKQVKKDDKVIASMNTSTEYNKQTLNINTYYSDGYIYSSMINPTTNEPINSKTEMDYEQFSSLQGSNGLLIFTKEDLLNDVVVEDNKDTNGKKYTFVIKKDSEPAKEYFDKTINSIAKSTGLSTSQIKSDFSDITFVINADSKGKAVSTNEVFTSALTIVNQNVEAFYDIDTTYIKFKDVSVDVPADLSVYKDFSKEENQTPATDDNSSLPDAPVIDDTESSEPTASPAN